MGRKPKQGIDFYPLDIGFLRDAKIKRLRQKRGGTGILIYLAILDHIYGGTGYYVVVDDDLLSSILDDTSGKYGPDENIVRAVIEDCCSLGLLSRVADSKTITAHRVQEQFYLATKRRTNILVDRAKWILSKDEMEKLGADSPIYRFFVSVDKNGISADKNDVFAGNNPHSNSYSNIVTHTHVPPGADAVKSFFTVNGSNAEEADAFLRYNEQRGWDCLPDWERKATVWITIANKHGAGTKFARIRKTGNSLVSPSSFEVSKFFEAAVEKAKVGGKENETIEHA